MIHPSIFDDQHFLDFHTHKMRHAHREDVIEIVSLHLGKESDKACFTVGMHPWWTEEEVTPSQRELLNNMLTDPNCVAMGEMGLDQLKGPPINQQMDILRSQLKIAAALNKPVIIHCVRAFDQLISIKKEFPTIKKWCVHSYGRHAILARQLINQGFYLSLMPTIDQKYIEWFTALPHNKLFLETDSMPDTDILELYSRVANLSGMSVEKLRAQMNNNARDFFER